MAGTFRLRVPELLKARKEKPQDLMWGVRLSSRTAYKMALGRSRAIQFDTLWRLKEYFGLRRLDDLFEEVPATNGRKPKAGRKGS